MSQNLTPVSDGKKHPNTDMSGFCPQQVVNQASAKFTRVSFHENYLIDIYRIINLVWILLIIRKWHKNKELEMDLIRCLVTSLLLVFSGQSLALFMPDGFTVNTDAAEESDGGCGSLTIDLREYGES